MKNIPVHHDSFDHELLRDMLLSHEGDFVLSYNNCETIREYYSDFEFFFPKWHYSMDIGEKRIGDNRKNRTSVEELDKVDQLTMEIDEQAKSISTMTKNSDEYIKANKKLTDLKSKRHEIMKKESHEILIIKKTP